MQRQLSEASRKTDLQSICMDSNLERVQTSAHAATPLSANPAASDDASSSSLRSETTGSTSVVDIYQDIHQSIDSLEKQTLVIGTVIHENARVLSRLAAVERSARVLVEASSQSCAHAQSGPLQTPPYLQCSTRGSRHPHSLVLESRTLYAAPEEHARNGLTANLEHQTTPTSAFSTGGGSIDIQDVEKSSEIVDGAGLLPHCDQASHVSRSHSASCRDHEDEEGEDTTSGESRVTSPSAETFRNPFDPTSSARTTEEKETRQREMQNHMRSQLATSNKFSDQTESPERRSPSEHVGGRKRKRDQHEGESLERIAESFGTESDLAYFEQIVDNARTNAHWISGAWTPRTLLSMPNVDPLSFVQALPTLMKELEDNDFAERLLGVKQRMALAHFYSTYRSAHANHEMFLRWTDGLGDSGVSLTPSDGRRTESVVKQRFIDISVWQCQRDRKQAAVKINNWQRCGKPWADLIIRLGYSSLLLVPPSMTNKR